MKNNNNGFFHLLGRKVGTLVRVPWAVEGRRATVGESALTLSVVVISINLFFDPRKQILLLPFK